MDDEPAAGEGPDTGGPGVRDADARGPGADEAQLAATVLHASRGLLGVIARSVAEALDEVSLPQLRALVLLCSAGPLRQGAVADQLGVHSSTFSRNVDRLVAGGWVRRTEDPARRHGVLLEATGAGRALVERVSTRRRDAIAEVLQEVPPQRREAMVAALAEFTRASGEPDPRDMQTLAL